MLSFQHHLAPFPLGLGGIRLRSLYLEDRVELEIGGIRCRGVGVGGTVSVGEKADTSKAKGKGDGRFVGRRLLVAILTDAAPQPTALVSQPPVQSLPLSLDVLGPEGALKVAEVLLETLAEEEEGVLMGEIAEIVQFAELRVNL